MINCLLKQLEQIRPRFEVLVDTKNILIAAIIQRFGLIEQIKPIAIVTILDPRFKNLHFNNAVACFNAMTELRQLSKPDLSSSESEGEAVQSNSDSYDFWAPPQIVSPWSKKKSHFHT